jgi:hypothetical protein
VRSTFGIWYQTLALATRRIQVTKWRAEGPATGRQRGLHADAGPIRSDVIVELRDRRQDTISFPVDVSSNQPLRSSVGEWVRMCVVSQGGRWA